MGQRRATAGMQLRRRLVEDDVAGPLVDEERLRRVVQRHGALRVAQILPDQLLELLEREPELLLDQLDIRPIDRRDVRHIPQCLEIGLGVVRRREQRILLLGQPEPQARRHVRIHDRPVQPLDLVQAGAEPLGVQPQAEVLLGERQRRRKQLARELVADITIGGLADQLLHRICHHQVGDVEERDLGERVRLIQVDRPDIRPAGVIILRQILDQAVPQLKQIHEVCRRRQHRPRLVALGVIDRTKQRGVATRNFVTHGFSLEPRGAVMGFVVLHFVDVVKQQLTPPTKRGAVNFETQRVVAGEQHGPATSEFILGQIGDLDRRVKPALQQSQRPVLLGRGQDAHQPLIRFQQRRHHLRFEIAPGQCVTPSRIVEHDHAPVDRRVHAYQSL